MSERLQDVEGRHPVLEGAAENVNNWRALARARYEEIQRLRSRLDEEVAAHKETAVELEYALAALSRKDAELRLRKRIIDGLPMCPDHRDKFRGRCVACELERKDAALREARAVIDMLWTAIQDGDPCYLEPDRCEDYIGNAVRLTEAQDDRVLRALASEPGHEGCDYCEGTGKVARQTPNPEPCPDCGGSGKVGRVPGHEGGPDLMACMVCGERFDSEDDEQSRAHEHPGHEGGDDDSE